MVVNNDCGVKTRDLDMTLNLNIAICPLENYDMGCLNDMNFSLFMP